MRLLIVAQVIDIEHPVLGFFHRWVEEFAKKCDQVHVIALQVGDYDLPENVTVHSLGKELGNSKLGYVFRFYNLVWKLRKDYDNVFVHMNQIYVILGAPFWRLFGRKIGLWYAHGAVSVTLKVAVLFTDYVFTSTEEGLRVKTKKRVIVGQGIDTDNFKTAPKEANSVLRLVTVGRISQSKNLETLLKACAVLKQSGVSFSFQIIGTPTTEVEEQYKKKMLVLIESLGIIDEVNWSGAISNRELPGPLQQSDVFIHDGSTNSLDKVLLEAVLCGCIVVSSNPAYKSLVEDIVPESIYTHGIHGELADIIMNSDFDNWDTDKLRAFCKDNFTVSNLAQNIIKKYK